MLQNQIIARFQHGLKKNHGIGLVMHDQVFFDKSPITKFYILVFATEFAKIFHVEKLAALSNDDDEGNENVKKAIGLITKTTTLYVHFKLFCAFLLSGSEAGFEFVFTKSRQTQLQPRSHSEGRSPST